MFVDFVGHSCPRIYVPANMLYFPFDLYKCYAVRIIYQLPTKLRPHEPAKFWLPTNIGPHEFKWFHSTQLYDKQDDFSFSIVNFPYLFSNIPSSPAYGVCVSQLIRCAGACSACDQFLNRGKLLADKLLLRGLQQSRLKAAFCKLYGRYNDLVYQYGQPFSQMLSDVFHSHC